MTERAKMILQELIKESGKTLAECKQRNVLETLVANSPLFQSGGKYWGSPYEDVLLTLEDNDSPAQRMFLVELLFPSGLA
ncbi:hypothetical protein SH16_01457 [Aeromonas caviae]|uniref:hypothetical protein n=1 Tax=Aeromonas caviae TaxID=648 RepID=UPI000651544F|nr:hypothetical protein [Aeromonas caviae]KLV47724.1 hypothetical protein SH16_01457 [Aeromonas caviae]